MPHIFDVLHQDHEKVAQILKQIERSSDNETEERTSLIALVREELETHARFEEKEVYPAIQKALGKEGELRHAVEEHVEAVQLLSELAKSAQDENGAWKNQVKQLETSIEHHVHEEEHELFPKAREKLAAGQAERLASDYQSFKDEAKV